MKKFCTTVFFIGLLLVSCAKEETKLETFNPEAFAYDLGDSWEVNAVVNVKGFEQRKNPEKNNFEASISYSADIKTPAGKIIKDIYTDKADFSSKEEILDVPIEVQFDLDSTYTEGTYRITFNLEDNFSDGKATSSVDFDLEE
jgi:hypothetical protein